MIKKTVKNKNVSVDNEPPSPIVAKRKLANNWWAIAWNENLASYADYRNRIARGRSYLRNGAILDLKITEGLVTALVQGSRKRPYKVCIKIASIDQSKWDNILKKCKHSIESLESLLEGKFPDELSELFTKKGIGLFPSPREISFDCSCPDWAVMCKHVTACLYGIGVRLDDEPLLFFKLRNIDFEKLFKKSIEEKLDSMLKNIGKPTKRTLINADIKNLFGV